MTAIFLMSRPRGRRPFSFLSSVTDSAASRWDRSLPSVAESVELDRIFGDVWVVEQPQGELVAQHAAHGLVQPGLIRLAALDGLGQHFP